MGRPIKRIETAVDKVKAELRLWDVRQEHLKTWSMIAAGCHGEF